MIYLDNASTTMIDPRVYAEMEPYLKWSYGNPGSVHQLGTEARDAISLARERVAKSVNAKPHEIIFTSCGSESNNLAIKLATEMWDKDYRVVLTSKLEHDSMKKAVSIYSSKSEFLPYYFDEEKLLKYIASNAPSTSVVSFMYVNNELGILNRVDEICKIAKKEECISVIDAVQALGNEIIDVKKIGCDFMSFSSHKIHGPKGVGALYINDYSSYKEIYMPLIAGGDNQEFGLRGGTENVAGIVGFGKACELIDIDKTKEIIAKLRKELICGFNFDYRINFNREDSKIISLTIPGVDAETLVLLMSSNGVCISAGSACKSLEQKPNEVLLASHFTEDDARNTVRISLSTMNNIDEIKCAANIMNDCVKILRGGKKNGSIY